jgi:hypothetical protein
MASNRADACLKYALATVIGLIVLSPLCVNAEDKENLGQPRPRCFPRERYERSEFGWVQEFYAEKKRVAPVGKVVASGEALLYIQLADVRKVAVLNDTLRLRRWALLKSTAKDYPAKSRFNVKALFTPDFVNYANIVFFNEPDDIYSGYTLVIKSDGMSCSAMVDLIQGGSVWFYESNGTSVYHEVPITFETEILSGRPLRAISVVVKELNAASITLEIVQSIDGKVTTQRQKSFDTMGGSADFDGLGFEFTKVAGGIRLNAVKEPSMWNAWWHDLRHRYW